MVLGAQMCSWENRAAEEIARLRHRLAAFGERVWDPVSEWRYADFSRRLRVADARLERLLAAVK
jgi:hexosaminidase